jgi:hypothetical protein
MTVALAPYHLPHAIENTNHRREPPVQLPDQGSVPSGHGSIPSDYQGAPTAGTHRHWSGTQG